jgi:predicted metalloprotease with PDZ domain
MRTMRGGILLLVLVVAAAPLAAQGVVRTGASHGQQGWIGVSFQILTTGDASGVHTEATITDIMSGSPAQKAGLRPGDRLLSVNGEGYENNFGRLSHTLRPGDSVRILVERDGRRREFRLRAVTLPPNVVPPMPTLTWTVSTDSVVDVMFRAMDSLRHRLDGVVAGGGRVAVGAPGLADALAGHPGTAAFPEVGPPLHAYASARAAHDSLLRAMQDVHAGTSVKRALAEVRADGEQTAEFRPLTPYRLGQDWVAGAQMVELKPDLGAYFQVESGVLVVKVPEGTPAALGGLQPGDVIVEAQGKPVHSIADLRTGLSEPGDTLRLQVVRKGRTVQALLGR